MKSIEEQSTVYLDTYVLQQDMRIRMPKVIKRNIPAIPGETMFDIFYNSTKNEIVLKPTNKDK